MSRWLAIEATFLSGRYHGRRGEGRETDWPPSPYRLFQALLASAHLGSRTVQWSSAKEVAFRWLERRQPPEIRAPRAYSSSAFRLSVPNNDMDIVARAWARRSRSRRRPSELRAAKTLRPVALEGDATVRYLWPITDGEWEGCRETAELICDESRHLHHLGLGVDLVAARGRMLDDVATRALPGEAWSPGAIPKRTRVPVDGSYAELVDRYAAFVRRLSAGTVDVSQPPRCVGWVGYRRRAAELPHETYAFGLVREGGGWASFEALKVAHVSAWLRHAAREAATSLGFDFPFIDRYVSGHSNDPNGLAERLTYVPLPSIGHAHVDGRIRRALLVRPALTSDPRADAIVRSLQGAVLRDEAGVVRSDLQRLDHAARDGVFATYLSRGTTWGSVTPVVLPGFDDRDFRKATGLVLKALAQAGCHTPVTEVTLQRLPVFPGADRAERYFVPSYLRLYPRTHVILSFSESVGGPLVIGSGRYVGLGLMAPLYE